MCIEHHMTSYTQYNTYFLFGTRNESYVQTLQSMTPDSNLSDSHIKLLHYKLIQWVKKKKKECS